MKTESLKNLCFKAWLNEAGRGVLWLFFTAQHKVESCVDRATSFYSSVRLSFLISLLIKVALGHRDVLRSTKSAVIVLGI